MKCSTNSQQSSDYSRVSGRPLTVMFVHFLCCCLNSQRDLYLKQTGSSKLYFAMPKVLLPLASYNFFSHNHLQCTHSYDRIPSSEGEADGALNLVVLRQAGWSLSFLLTHLSSSDSDNGRDKVTKNLSLFFNLSSHMATSWSQNGQGTM